jgi:hypothetical protein
VAALGTLTHAANAANTITSRGLREQITGAQRCDGELNQDPCAVVQPFSVGQG